MGFHNKEIKDKAEKLGLRDEDFDRNLNSLDELLDAISASGRLYRKSLKNIVLNKIRAYLGDESIADADELARFFPRRGRQKKWIDFSATFDLVVPKLHLTTFAVTLLVLYTLTVLGLLFTGVGSKTHILFHLSGLSLWSVFIVLMSPMLPVILLGRVKLPGKTIEDLIDGIIQKNMADLLTDDRKEFKELIKEELS